MTATLVVGSNCSFDLSEIRMPGRVHLAAPVEEPPTAPTKTPAKPDIETEPNTIPVREPLPEPDADPCERPGTSCPVR